MKTKSLDPGFRRCDSPHYTQKKRIYNWICLVAFPDGRNDDINVPFILRGIISSACHAGAYPLIPYQVKMKGGVREKAWNKKSDRIDHEHEQQRAGNILVFGRA